MRLYRGEATSCKWPRLGWATDELAVDAAGRWFTPEIDIAQWYVDDAIEGHIIFIDVDDAEQYRVCNLPFAIRRFSKDPEHEYFVPREWAEQARPFSGLVREHPCNPYLDSIGGHDAIQS